MVPDRFSLLEQVGAGGFAEVWHAKDRQNGGDVAIKIIETSDDRTGEDVVDAGFERESSTLARWKNAATPSSVVRYVDSGTRERKYIVVEYIDGPELDEFLMESDIEPGIDALTRFGLPTFRCLEFLHENDLCYLDLKPENILVRGERMRPVVIDFNTVVGSDEQNIMFSEDDFKSPEQVRGSSYDSASLRKADVYAAGKLAYYLLTGRTSFDEKDPPAVSELREQSGELTDNTMKIVENCTTPSPTERLGTVVPLINEIRSATASGTLSHKKGRITTTESDVACPVRPGDTVGRVSADGDIPDIEINDPNQYISPLHFEITHDGTSWVLRDRSLNGTYVSRGSGYDLLISDRGYERLSQKAPNQIPDENPPSETRVQQPVDIRPVNAEYPVSLSFHPHR
jgi:protein kinase/serine/threonine-protein kinase